MIALTKNISEKHARKVLQTDPKHPKTSRHHSSNLPLGFLARPSYCSPSKPSDRPVLSSNVHLTGEAQKAKAQCPHEEEDQKEDVRQHTASEGLRQHDDATQQHSSSQDVPEDSFFWRSFVESGPESSDKIYKLGVGRETEL